MRSSSGRRSRRRLQPPSPPGAPAGGGSDHRGVGRALGEAMAINMVAGGAVNLPLPFNSVRTLTTQIVSEMSYAEGLHREVLFTVGLVLFVFIMIINLILAQVEKRGAVEQ